MDFKGRKIQTFMICLIHFSTSDRDSRYMWSIDPMVTSNQSCRFRTRRFGFNLQSNRPSIERWLIYLRKSPKKRTPVKKTEFNVVNLTYLSGNFSFNGMLFSFFFLLEIWGKVLRKKIIELSFCTLHPGDVINSNAVERVEKLLPHKSATAIAWSLGLYFVF